MLATLRTSTICGGRLLLLLAALSADAALGAPRRPPRPPPAPQPPPAAAEPATEAVPLGYQPPQLRTPKPQLITAPPPRPEDPAPELPGVRFTPGLRFQIAFDPVVLEDRSTWLSHGGVDAAFFLRAGRLLVEATVGTHTVKETDTPVSSGLGFGAGLAGAVDVFSLGHFWLRLGAAADYAGSEGHFLREDFVFRYQFFNVEGRAGVAWVHQGLDLGLAVAGRYVIGRLEAPAPIGTLAIRTGGPRSQFKLGGSSIGLGLRATARWSFRLVVGSQWGGSLAATFEALAPWGGSVAVGLWF